MADFGLESQHNGWGPDLLTTCLALTGWMMVQVVCEPEASSRFVGLGPTWAVVPWSLIKKNK